MGSWKILRLQTNNFRNLLPNIVTFSPGINCIIGENGNGKTNILEAIFVLATKKSFRKNAGLPQFLSFDGEKPEIILSSQFQIEGKNPVNISAKIRKGFSQWFLEGKLTRKKIPIDVVFINPFDSYSFHQISSFRRHFFDHYIGEIDEYYKKVLSNYNTSLRFRNSLLSKKPQKFIEQIKVINTELAKYSKIITERRVFFLREIEKFSGKAFKEIFSEEHTLKVSLDSKVVGASESQIISLLEKNLEKDIILGHTRYGVHRDDYMLLFDGLNSFEFCSLGQQKMSYLSLLFAYIELFRYKFNTYPIVLIDDVSGELDRYRWDRLVRYLKHRDFQVLITTANENFKKELEKIEGTKKIKVTSGEITDEI